MTDRQAPATKSWDRRGAAHPITGTMKLAPAEAAAPSHVERTSPVHEAPELLSRRQAAERFGLDAGVLTRWEKAGRLTPRRQTPRGRVYYSVGELKHAVSEHKGDRPEADGRSIAAELVLPPEQLWAMVEEARRDALKARTRASAAEAEVTLLREMLDRLLSERVDASSALPNGETAERARRWAEQWEQHEEQQERQQQREQEASPRGAWWSRNRVNG